MSRKKRADVSIQQRMDRPSRPKPSERTTRSPSAGWDRVKFLILLAFLWLCGLATVWTTVNSVGGPFSDAAGLFKEIEDARSGSGFSFDDIAADRAGTRFGEYAANPVSAQKLQRQLSGGIGEKDIMPRSDDLPEFLSEK